MIRLPNRHLNAVTPLLLALVLLFLPACQSEAPTTVTQPGPPTVESTGPLPPVSVQSLAQEPVLRVRVQTAVVSVRLDGPRQLRVRGGNGTALATQGTLFGVPVMITRCAGTFFISSPQGRYALAATRVLVEPVEGDDLRINGRDFPGSVMMEPAGNSAPQANTFDLINYVALEKYLPGVLDRELYKSWHPEMYRAQAIAARSYAIAQLARQRPRPYDVEAGTAGQMYGGVTANPKAGAAVQATRGLVLTWQGQVLPAYYSSCCGGAGQDGYKAIGDAPNLPPLQGHFHGAWCAESNYYRWGPIARNRHILGRRLAAWGEANHHPIAQLRGIASITVAERNAAGRPTRFAVADLTGKVYDLGPEEFRFACNYTASNVPLLADAATLKSSYVDVRVVADQVQFITGRGYGHGVGLCQWGAQGLALKGYTYVSILNFYYPGAKITQAY